MPGANHVPNGSRLDELNKPVPSFNAAFFNRSADKLAPDLLGKKLVSSAGGVTVEAIIADVHAYPDNSDPDTKKYKGPPTRGVTWEAGSLYVYSAQGHVMLTLATPPYDQGGCVLIRGVRIITGQDEVTARQVRVEDSGFVKGSGRVSKALGITVDSCCGKNILTLDHLRLENGEEVASDRVVNSRRENSETESPLRWRIV